MPRRIVEGDDADAAFLASEHLVGLGHFISFQNCCLHHTAFALCRAVISRALKPNSLRMASVCSPRSGGRATRRDGVRDNKTGWPIKRILLLSFLVTLWAMPRCSTCGSAHTRSIQQIRPQGTTA